MKIAINTTAMTVGDLDFSGFEALGELTCFGEVTRAELKNITRDCEALIVNKVAVDRDLLSASPKLKYVGTFATGYNVVDVEECRRRGITVCNVPDYSTRAVSQHTFALLLAIYGRIREYASSVDNGDWIKSKTFTYFPWPTREIYGKTFGIVGYGNIGKSVAKIAEAFGANVVISTRTPPQNCPYKCLSLGDILGASDILSLHCPLTPATQDMIDKNTISLMKDGAVLINTARGGLVDEYALRDALLSGKLAGAGLDVVREEPMSPANPLRGIKNCLITPHTAWVAPETRRRLLDIAVENLRAFIAGKPQNVVS